MERLALVGGECHHIPGRARRRPDERRPSPRRAARDRRGLRDHQRAGRLTVIGQAARSRRLARDDPQRHGGPRGGRLHRPAAHLRGPRPHGQGLPVVRGPPLGRQATVRRRAARDRRFLTDAVDLDDVVRPLGAAAVPAHPPGGGRAVPVAGPLRPAARRARPARGRPPARGDHHRDRTGRAAHRRARARHRRRPGARAARPAQRQRRRTAAQRARRAAGGVVGAFAVSEQPAVRAVVDVVRTPSPRPPRSGS